MTHPHHHDDLDRCRETLASLNAYADGDLAADLCHTLETHLAGCPDCRIVLDTLTRTITLYRALSDAPCQLPDEVAARLVQRLRTP